MPKVTYGKDPMLERNKKQALHTIEHCMVVHDYNSIEMGTKIGMSKTTLNERKKDPSNLTLKELCKIYKMLNIDFKLPSVVIGGD